MTQHTPPDWEYLTYRNTSSGETKTLHVKNVASFFRNRNPKEWELMT